MYEAQHAILKFEGREFAGLTKIMDKIQSLTFQKIARVITAVDCQPTFDGGILINVVGQLQLDLDPPQSFTQAFVLKEQRGIYLCFNDIFRIVK